MRSSLSRRLGAVLLLAAFLPSCAEVAPTSPALVPDGPAASREVRVTDGQGQRHHVKMDTRGGYITRVNHDVDGKPFARLAYHYLDRGDGTYSLARISGTIVWGGRRVDVGALWPQLAAAMEARGVRPAALAAGSAALSDSCYWEMAELAAWSAGMAIILGMSPVLWAEFFLALAGYTRALRDYKDCVSASGPF